MPKPGKQLFNPLAAAKAVLGSAMQQSEEGRPITLSRVRAGELAKPVRPTFQTQRQGPTAVTKQNRLFWLPMRRATAISTALHFAIPGFVLIAGFLLALLVAWLLHFNLWDLFKHKPPQDTTFTLVEDSHVKRPEKPMFKGNANQEAGGKQVEKQPLNPAKQSVAHPPAKEGKPAPPAKPQPAKMPEKAATPAPVTPPAPEPPKPQPQKQPEPPKPLSEMGKPAKAEKEKQEQPKPETPRPKNLNPKMAPMGKAPEPVQISTVSTDFGISTTPPGAASTGNPQEGKAKKPGVDVAQDVDYGPFMADLQKRIRRNWIPPRGMESRKLVLMFYVQRDGKVVKVEVEKSSGDPDADRSAIEAVQVSSPFMTLPPQIKEDVLPVEFTFDYNVLNPKNSKKALKW